MRVVPFTVVRAYTGHRRKATCVCCGKSINRGLFRNKDKIFKVVVDGEENLICKDCGHGLNTAIDEFVTNTCPCYHWNVIPTLERCNICPQMKDCYAGIGRAIGIIWDMRPKK